MIVWIDLTHRLDLSTSVNSSESASPAPSLPPLAYIDIIFFTAFIDSFYLVIYLLIFFTREYSPRTDTLFIWFTIVMVIYCAQWTIPKLVALNTWLLSFVVLWADLDQLGSA